MELILENPILLRRSMDIISELVLEGTIVFKPDYMEIVALNSNNVVMVIFRLLTINFEEYDIKKDFKVPLSLEQFSDVLRRCNERERLILNVDNKTNKLKITSEGKNKKDFELSIIDFTDDNLQKVPDLKFPTKIVTSSSNLTTAINDLSFLENGVSFNVRNETFSLSGKTNTMSGKVEMKENINIKHKDEAPADIKSKYSIEYLKKFIKADKIVNTVEISLNNDYPLKIEYKLMDKLLLGFILAPRGED